MPELVPNPKIQEMLETAKGELAKVRAEKASLFPPNLHPFAQPDTFPKDYTPEQIQQRNALNARIEYLENRVEELQRQLYKH